MTSDVAGSASVIARLGGGAAHPENTWLSRDRASHHRARAAGPLAHDRRLVTLDAYACSAISPSSVPTGLELDVWLARSLVCYAARKRSIENTVPRDNM
jgi:hypothetical protein